MKSWLDEVESLRKALKDWQPDLAKAQYPIKSPKATGEPGKFTLGQTKSGKTIHSDPMHPSHSSFTPAEHAEAHFAHRRHFESLKDMGGVHQGLLSHHASAMEYHKQKSLGKSY